MIPDLGFINLDDLAHRLQSIVLKRCFDASPVSRKPATLPVRPSGLQYWIAAKSAVTRFMKN
jgi:hypothetical protein